MFLLSGLKTYFIMAVLVSGLGAGAYMYYQTTQAKIEALKAENLLYETANESLEKTLGEVRTQQKITQRNAEELTRSLQSLEKQNNELRKKFIEHDLTDLAINKPGRIESIINEGTKDVFDSIESITSE